MSRAASSLSAVSAWPRRGGPDRGLVQDVGERLVPGPDDAERRGGRFDVGDARARRNQAEVGMANRRIRRGADAAGGIDDRQRHAVTIERLQALFDVAGCVDRLDDRLGIGTPALPVRKRCPAGRSRSGGQCARPGWRQAQGRWQACFCRSHPFGWPIRSSAFQVLWMAFGGIWVTPYEVRRILRRRAIARSDVPSPIQRLQGSRLSESVTLQ